MPVPINVELIAAAGAFIGTAFGAYQKGKSSKLGREVTAALVPLEAVVKDVSVLKEDMKVIQSELRTVRNDVDILKASNERAETMRESMGRDLSYLRGQTDAREESRDRERARDAAAREDRDRARDDRERARENHDAAKEDRARARENHDAAKEDRARGRER